MTAKEKRAFILNFCKQVGKKLANEVPRMPEHWNGHELREYVADEFDSERFMRNPYNRRRFTAEIRRYERTKRAMWGRS